MSSEAGEIEHQVTDDPSVLIQPSQTVDGLRIKSWGRHVSIRHSPQGKTIDDSGDRHFATNVFEPVKSFPRLIRLSRERSEKNGRTDRSSSGVPPLLQAQVLNIPMK
jgi:hypothetical protein